MKIAITGPTGNIGSKLVRLLLDRPEHQLILLARDRRRVAEFESAGAEVRTGDLQDANYVNRATAGADSLFWMIPPDLTTPDITEFQDTIIRNGTDAIRGNHIRQVVFLSSIGAHRDSGTGPINGLHRGEEVLRSTGASLLILRPGFFMENFLWQIQPIEQDHALFFPVSGSVSLPLIATRDIAAVAADVLAGSFAGVRRQHLLGPRDYSLEEATRILGQALGFELTYVRISSGEARDNLLRQGMSASIADSFIELYKALENGWMRPEYPRDADSTTPTTLEDFAREVFVPAYQHTLAAAR